MEDQVTVGLSCKLASMDTVREYSEGGNVELWRNPIGRLVIRSFNKGRDNHTDVDAVDLVNWMKLLAPKQRSPPLEMPEGPPVPVSSEIDPC